MASDLRLDLDQQLRLQIAQFKGDPDRMREVNEFLSELLEKAQKEAEIRSKSKNKLDALSVQNGTKRIGAWSNRARTQARTFATRIFTTICNCTNSVRSVVVNRN